MTDEHLTASAGGDVTIVPVPAHVTMRAWLKHAARATFLKRPGLHHAVPSRWQLLAVLVFVTLASLALDRLRVMGPAGFNVRDWLAAWWTLAPLLFAAWLLRPAPQAGVPRGTIAGFFMLWLPSLLLPSALSMAVYIAGSLDLGDAPWLKWVLWGGALAVMAWFVASCAAAATHFLPLGRACVLGVLMLAINIGNEALLGTRYWYSTAPRAEFDYQSRFVLTQQAIEAQQAAWQRQVGALAPQRPGVVDVYGLVFAPYASEDVFLRESTLVAGVLAERFDAGGRVLHLVNHASTSNTHGWATLLNLQRGIEQLAARLDREEDVLVVYLTSHGARDFRLAADHEPLAAGTVTPRLLREALDAAGIRHRVVAVSACYSGGWVEPLANDSTLVMTAADADHTSYGCGRRSELTFFGRALWDEQLRKTHSFEEAFAAAVPVIRQREVEAGKPDGFSNPQIRVGEAIRPVLRTLAQRLAP